MMGKTHPQFPLRKTVKKKKIPPEKARRNDSGGMKR